MTNIFCTLVFLKRDNSVLLAMKKRGFGAGLWNGAGGKIEAGETPEQAMIRECQEEIGVTPTTYEKVAEQHFVLDADTAEPWHMYVHAYVATAWQGEPVESEEMAPQWFAISDIPYHTMWQDDPLWLPDVLAGHRMVGAYEFAADNTLISHQVKRVTMLPGAIPVKP